MVEYVTITRSELAARLDVSEDTLLTREEASAIIGIKPTYLSNLKNDGPCFYRPTEAPTGGVAWYPRATVEAYGRHRAAKSRSSFSGPIGRLAWPPRDDTSRRTVPVHLVVAMIERWKKRELYRRAQSVLNEPLGRNETHDEELRLFGAHWPSGRMAALDEAVADTDSATRADIFKSMDDQAIAVQRKLRALCDAEGIFPSFVHPSYQVLSSLMEGAWKEVVMAEMRWRNLDYSGMPSQSAD